MDKNIEELERRIKELEEKVAFYKMLGLSKPIYIEPYREQTTTPCRQCNGTGQIRLLYPYDNSTGGQLTPCPICHGSGVIMWTWEYKTTISFPYN